MGYQVREAENKRKDTVHPIWRGIGCLLFILFPIIAFSGTTILYSNRTLQKYFPLTADLAYPVAVPWFGTLPLPYILIVTAVITFFGYFMLTILYSLIFSMGRGSRYGPLDAPPIKRKSGKPRKSR